MALTLLKAAGKLYMFNIRAKQETYNDSPRVRYTITKMIPVDYVKAGEELADAIKKYL
jgi:replication factor A1